MDARLEKWIRETYQERTKAIESGVVNIDWLDPRYRITVTEIVVKADSLGLKLDMIELRRWLATQEGKWK